MILLINDFINDLPISLALSTITTIATCAPEPIAAEPTLTPHLLSRRWVQITWPIYVDIATRCSLLDYRFQHMCWCSFQTIYQFLNCVDRPSKIRLMINNVRHTFSGTLPSCLLHVWCNGWNGENGQESVHKQEVFASKKKTCATHFPISGKRHHTNQSQNYMANHVIWLLRNRGKLWEERQRKTDRDSDGDR